VQSGVVNKFIGYQNLLSSSLYGSLPWGKTFVICGIKDYRSYSFPRENLESEGNPRESHRVSPSGRLGWLVPVPVLERGSGIVSGPVTSPRSATAISIKTSFVPQASVLY